METPVASNPRSGVRTVVFAVLAVLVIAALMLNGEETTGPDSPWGRLYRHAGDTYTQVFYLATSVGPRTLRGDPLLRQSLDYYGLSAKIDPKDRLTRLSRALVLASLGQTKESEELLRGALEQERQDPGRAQVRAVLLAIGSAYPTPAQIEAVQQAVGDLAPGPAFVARLYLANGDQGRAEQALLAGRERAQSLVLPLLAAAVVWALILLAGLIGLIGLVARRGRRRHTPPVQARWGLREGLEALILFFVIQVAVGLPLARWPQVVASQPFVLFLPSVIGGLGAIAWVRLVTPGAKDLGWRTGGVWRQLLIGVAAAGVMVLPVMLLGNVAQGLVKQVPSEHPIVPIFTDATSWVARFSLILGTVAIAPVLEETIFRGILYGAIRRRWSAGVAIVASAVIFAVAHPHSNIVGVVPYFVVGAVLAWLYERTGSLVAPAAAHGAFNLFNVAALLVLFR